MRAIYKTTRCFERGSSLSYVAEGALAVVLAWRATLLRGYLFQL